MVTLPVQSRSLDKVTNQNPLPSNLSGHLSFSSAQHQPFPSMQRTMSAQYQYPSMQSASNYSIHHHSFPSVPSNGSTFMPVSSFLPGQTPQAHFRQQSSFDFKATLQELARAWDEMEARVLHLSHLGTIGRDLSELKSTGSDENAANSDASTDLQRDEFIVARFAPGPQIQGDPGEVPLTLDEDMVDLTVEMERMQHDIVPRRSISTVDGVLPNHSLTRRPQGVVQQPSGTMHRYCTPCIDTDVAIATYETTSSASEEPTASRSSQLFAVFRSLRPNPEIGRRVSANSARAGKRDPWVISPTSRWRLLWDLVTVCCLIFELWNTLFVITFLTSDGVPDSMEHLRTAVTMVFIIDIFVNFNTGYVNGDTMVMRRKRIAKHYLKTWFIIDLVAAIPFSLLLSSGNNVNSVSRVARMSRFLATLRWLKMVRLMRFAFRFERNKRFSRLSKMWAPGERLTGAPMKAFAILVVLAHLHGCARAWLLETPLTADIDKAFRRYYSNYSWAFISMLCGFGGPGPSRTRILEMIMASERAIFVLISMYKLVLLVVLHHDSIADDEMMQDTLVHYLREHEVEPDLQIQAVHHLEQKRRVTQAKRQFDDLAKQEFPRDLDEKIRVSMWSRHLVSLELISRINAWCSDFVGSLALIVTEEVFPGRSVVYNEGDLATGAYCILSGSMTLTKSEYIELTYTDGMWIGEKSLVNPNITRSSTCATTIMSLMMFVDAKAFRTLLGTYGVKERFEQLCADEICKGLCGRCGTMGTHFPLQCQGPGYAYPTTTRKSGHSKGSDPILAANSPWSKHKTNTSVEAQFESGTTGNVATASFIEFLAQKQLEWLEPALERLQIRTLDQLKTVDIEALEQESREERALTRRLWTPDVEVALRPDIIEAFQAKLSTYIFGSNKNEHEHLLFLSHCKAEAGTECALIHAELEQLLAEAPDLPANKLRKPIFLDTEDLTNLEEVQMHVRHSHNVALVLTPSVLMRPWCLVEIATAYQAGVRLLPVELYKKGQEFHFPDETFYHKLRNGELLDRSGMEVLQDCNVELTTVEIGIREMFKQITLPYSPQRPTELRKTELKALLKQLRMKRGRGQGHSPGGGGGEIRSPSRRYSLSSSLTNDRPLSE